MAERVSKAELVAMVAQKVEGTKKSTEKCLNALIEAITEALKGGKRVEIRGFGVFEMKRRGKRVARNPKTGETVEVPAKLVPTFKAGKNLKEATKKILKK